MENGQDETAAKKNFASLPVQLRELVLSKTDTATRFKLFQINNELREWVLEEKLFGEDMERIDIWEPSETYIVPRNGFLERIDLSKQYVFKGVRRCKQLTFREGDFALTRILPRLQSINHFEFDGTNFTRLSQMFMGTAIQVTGFCRFNCDDLEEMTRNHERLLQFIENHMKRCKIVHFGQFPLEKLFRFLGTQHFSHAITECFESDLKMVLENGIPGLHPDPAIWMNIRASDRGMNGLLRIIRSISTGTDVVMEHEAIRKKFLVAYGKVDGFSASETFKYSQIQFFYDSEIEFFGLKRKFDDKRNLIFLVYPTYPNEREYINIHVKFDPIEE